LLISSLRRWWWKRGYKKFHGSDADRANVYAMNADNKKRFDALVKELKSLLKPLWNDVVLDMGGGNGILSSNVFGTCKMTIVLDFSLESMKGHVRRSPSTYFVASDSARPPFKNGSFSKVFVHGLLPNLGSEGVVHQMVQKWDQLLIYGGVLYIGDIPDRKKFLSILIEAIRRCTSILGFKYCVAIMLNSYFSKTGLKKHLSKMGYTVTIINQSNERRFHNERFDLLAMKNRS